MQLEQEHHQHCVTTRDNNERCRWSPCSDATRWEFISNIYLYRAIP